jgi:DNA-binding NarL/FixJ family response regulator
MLSMAIAPQSTAPIKTRAMQIVEHRMGEPVEQVVSRLYAGGMSQQQIADALGITRRTVIYWMQFFGIETRDPRGPRVLPDPLT